MALEDDADVFSLRVQVRIAVVADVAGGAGVDGVVTALQYPDEHDYEDFPRISNSIP